MQLLEKYKKQKKLSKFAGHQLSSTEIFGKEVVVQSNLQGNFHCCLVILMIFWNTLFSKLCYTRGITPKRVTSGGNHICGLALGHHNSEETPLLATLCPLTGPGIESQTYRITRLFVVCIRLFDN